MRDRRQDPRAEPCSPRFLAISLVLAALVAAGSALAAEAPGKLALTTERVVVFKDGSTPLNNHSDIVWDLELGAGETHTLSYELFHYTR
jgi:hypothetical protein